MKEIYADELMRKPAGIMFITEKFLAKSRDIKTIMVGLHTAMQSRKKLFETIFNPWYDEAEKLGKFFCIKTTKERVIFSFEQHPYRTFGQDAVSNVADFISTMDDKELVLYMPTASKEATPYIEQRLQGFTHAIPRRQDLYERYEKWNKRDTRISYLISIYEEFLIRYVQHKHTFNSFNKTFVTVKYNDIIIRLFYDNNELKIYKGDLITEEIE